MRTTPIALAVLSAASIAVAQPAPTYEGTWAIKVDGKRAVDLGGHVTIKGSEGTWNISARDATNPCVGREFPLTVKSSTPEQVVLEVHRAQVLQGCRDSTYTFRRIDPATLEGDFGRGRVATLRRE